MKVRLTPSGRTQFLVAIAHVRRDRPGAAIQSRKRAEKALRCLERLPASGRVVPEFPDLPYRELIVPPYRFFYRVARDTVWIVGVWHGAQLTNKPST